jgi:predicted RNase H-like nuclease
MSGWIAGVDGCRAGWIVARHAIETPNAVTVTIYERFADILAQGPTLVAVDMPIGLPDRIGPGGRGPEAAIRALLGKRKSSVFSIPSRWAVETRDYTIARSLALETSDPPRSVAKQAFHIFCKITQIDQLLRNPPPGIDPPWSQRVFEVHPELAFWRMNGERPLEFAKKAKSGGVRFGSEERQRLLLAAGFLEEAVLRKPPQGGALDDMLDAFASLFVARRRLAGKARPFPDPPGQDAHGLPIAIWA